MRNDHRHIAQQPARRGPSADTCIGVQFEGLSDAVRRLALRRLVMGQTRVP